MIHSRNLRGNRAFTLIELLVVVLILGILVAVALPAYLGSIKDAKLKTANANGKAIASAYQSLYVKGGGVSYSTVSDTAVGTELNGFPQNPCDSEVGQDGYGIVKTTTSLTITPENDQGCDTPATITLGTP